MTRFVNVALRHYEGADPQWEAYGINESFYGCGESLQEARNDAREAAALLLDVPTEGVEVKEFHEHLVRAETESDPAVWVRTYQDDDADRMVRRREVRQIIADHLAAHPEHMITFAQGSGVMGDVVATVMFPEELLCELVGQFGDSERLYVAVPGRDGAIYWQCLSEQGLVDERSGAIALSDLPLTESSTIWEFMQLTQAGVEVAGNVTLAAA